MSVNQLAKALGVTAARMNDIVRGRRGVTADTALRLAHLGTSAEFGSAPARIRPRTAGRQPPPIERDVTPGRR